MVKIRIRSIVLSLIMFIFLMSIAHAAGNKLNFSRVDVKVGARNSNNLRDGDTIREDAKPGDKLEFRVEMKNTYTSAEDLKIRNVIVNVKIEGIDNGDDLEEESNEFDLSPGSTKRVTLKFQVPEEVDEDSFDVIITADGDDKNGTSHSAEMRLNLQINKESHKVKITRDTLSPAEVSCNRKNMQMAVTLLNIGTEDEDTVNLEISNSDLRLDIKDDIGQLKAEPNEPESRFSKVYRFNVPADAEAGSYPITLKVLYNNDRKLSEDTQTLTVIDCSQPKQENKTQNVDLSNQPSTTPDKTTVVVQEVPPDTVVSTEGFFKSNGFVIAIVIAEIIAVIVGIILLISLFGR